MGYVIIKTKTNLGQYSSLHEEIFLTEWNLGHFSEVVYMGYDTIF